jgi:hypothetical protein
MLLHIPHQLVAHQVDRRHQHDEGGDQQHHAAEAEPGVAGDRQPPVAGSAARGHVTGAVEKDPADCIFSTPIIG